MLIEKTLTKKISIASSTENVWDSLVNPVKIKEYLFGTETICTWVKGSDLIFRGEWEGKTYEDKGTILDIEPGRLLRYNYWSNFSPLPDRPENYSIITFELKPSRDSVELHLSQQGFASEEAFAHSDANWEQVLHKLKEITER